MDKKTNRYDFEGKGNFMIVQKSTIFWITFDGARLQRFRAKSVNTFTNTVSLAIVELNVDHLTSGKTELPRKHRWRNENFVLPATLRICEDTSCRQKVFHHVYANFFLIYRRWHIDRNAKSETTTEPEKNWWLEFQ